VVSDTAMSLQFQCKARTVSETASDAAAADTPRAVPDTFEFRPRDEGSNRRSDTTELTFVNRDRAPHE
jgi:hypothetical protein